MRKADNFRNMNSFSLTCNISKSAVMFEEKFSAADLAWEGGLKEHFI